MAPLMSGWLAGTHPPAYRMNGDNVEFRGYVYNWDLPLDNTQLYLMPEGFRPVQGSRQEGWNGSLSYTASPSVAYIEPDGVFTVRCAAASPLYLDGIFYSTASGIS